MFGFEIDALSGNPLGSPASLSMYNLGTIVFMPLEDDPAKAPDSYD